MAQTPKAYSALISQNLKTTSLIVAEKFGKRHADVLRSIDSLKIPNDFNERNFASVKYADKNGELRPAFELTRDGFVLLVMGFTGKAAMAWKIKFLEAFNAMEAALRTEHVTHVKAHTRRLPVIGASEVAVARWIMDRMKISMEEVK